MDCPPATPAFRASRFDTAGRPPGASPTPDKRAWHRTADRALPMAGDRKNCDRHNHIDRKPFFSASPKRHDSRHRGTENSTHMACRDEAGKSIRVTQLPLGILHSLIEQLF